MLCAWCFKYVLSTHYVSVSLQAELSKKEHQTADLQENIKTQQAEASKAKEELTRALGAMEKLKEGFNKERADWETEKASFINRAENAEAALNPVVDELTGVKRQIHAMTAAVFSKHLFLNTFNISFSCVVGLLMCTMVQELALAIRALMCKRS